MSDIPNRLREFGSHQIGDGFRLCREAADLIERQVAEIARLRKENDFFRARAGNDDKQCIYCGLGAAEQGKCVNGFPGCSRADDQMLCREVGAAMERDELKEERERLRALLREARPFVYEHGHDGMGNRESLLLYPRIDAALAEGK